MLTLPGLELRPALPSDAAALVSLQDAYPEGFRTGSDQLDRTARIAAMEKALTRYPDYVIVATIDEIVVGNISMYPVAGLDMDKVLAGDLPENALHPDESGTALYIAGLNITPHYQKTAVLPNLLIWLAEQLASHAPIIAYAQPSTDEGAALVDRFGFTVLPSTMEEPIWSLQVVSREAIVRPIGRRLYPYAQDTLNT